MMFNSPSSAHAVSFLVSVTDVPTHIGSSRERMEKCLIHNIHCCLWPRIFGDSRHDLLFWALLQYLLVLHGLGELEQTENEARSQGCDSKAHGSGKNGKSQT